MRPVRARIGKSAADALDVEAARGCGVAGDGRCSRQRPPGRRAGQPRRSERLDDARATAGDARSASEDVGGEGVDRAGRAPRPRRCRASAGRRARRRRAGRSVAPCAALHVVGEDLELRLRVRPARPRESSRFLFVCLRVGLLRVLADETLPLNTPRALPSGCPCRARGWCRAAARGRSRVWLSTCCVPLRRRRGRRACTPRPRRRGRTSRSLRASAPPSADAWRVEARCPRCLARRRSSPTWNACAALAAAACSGRGTASVSEQRSR